MEAMNNSIITQIPDFNEAIRAASGHPFRVWTLSDSINLLSMLAKCGHTLLLALIPDTDFGVCTSCEKSCVVCGCAQGSDSSLMTWEISNLFLFLDIPDLSHATLRPREQLLNGLVKNHDTGR